MGQGRHLGVDQVQHQRIVELPVDEQLQYLGGVPGGPAAGVVGLIGEDNWIATYGFRLLERLRRGKRRGQKLLPLLPQPPRKALGLVGG